MSGLYAQDLDPPAFMTLIQAVQWPTESLVMAFSPAQAILMPYVPQEALFDATDQGRLFSPAGELKWRRINGSIRAVYLGTPPAGLALTDYSHLLQGLQPQQRQLLLWGVRTDLQAEWLEQQVPQRFTYPISTSRNPRGRVALLVEDWLDEQGWPHFSRYHSLREIEEAYHAPR